MDNTYWRLFYTVIGLKLQFFSLVHIRILIFAKLKYFKLKIYAACGNHFVTQHESNGIPWYQISTSTYEPTVWTYSQQGKGN